MAMFVAATTSSMVVITAVALIICIANISAFLLVGGRI
jgi:hypothetical protein